MAAIPSSVPSAVPAAVTNDWLTVATTATERGNGPAQYGSADETVSNPVGGPDTSSTLTTAPVTAPAATGRLENAAATGGAWPHVNSGYDELYQQPAIQRQHGTPQGRFESASSAPANLGDTSYLTDENDYQTYDQVSAPFGQVMGTHNVPNNRVSTRRFVGHSNPDDHPTWYGYSENPAQAHLAMAAADYQSYDNADIGGYQIGEGSTPDLWMPDGTSQAYETPAPPVAEGTFSQDTGGDPGEGWA